MKQGADLSRLRLFNLAWPIILSNVSTPLLGLVDTAVIGNLGKPALIGAIAVAGMIFNFIYWGFGFLRMGTTGLVAQAMGAGDDLEVKASCYRAVLVGVLIGCLLVLLQVPIAGLAFTLLQGSSEVELAAATYFKIRIWAAPVSLSYLALLGYLIGRQKNRQVLALQLLLNGMNILLDFVFVVWLQWEVAGIAAATVISESLILLVGLRLVGLDIKRHSRSLAVPAGILKDATALKRMFVVNRDIMIRTLCLIFAFAWFTNQGAKAGDVILAANAILMQFIIFSAFFLDGFALAAEALVGSAIGAGNRERLYRTLRYSAELGFATACATSLGLYLVGASVVDLLTTVVSVRATTGDFMVWAIVAPVIAAACYLLDGVFIGATRTAEMRNAMLVSLAVYFAAWMIFQPLLGNHGLWLSLHVYFIARAVTLACYLPSVFHAAESAK